MYWPDYSLRSRRRPRWGLTLLLGLLLGLLAVVLLGSGWQALPGASEGDTAAMPTPLALTAPPQVAGGKSDAAPAGVPLPTATAAGPAIGPGVTGETVALAEPAPDFSLPDLFDDTILFTLSDYHGRPVILNFWASWCVPCRREMPALQATAANYAGEGLLLLGMNQTYLDDLAAARAFVEELGLSFPNNRDDNGAVGSDAYQIVGIPTTVFIDRDGEVAHIQIGEMSLEQITAYTERLIAGERLQP